MQKNGIRKKIMINFFLVSLIAVAAISIFFIINIKDLAYGEVFNRIIFELSFAVPLVLIFTIFAAYLIADKIADPIKKLQAAAGLISRGNLDYQVSIKTHDEIEDLADSFNEMALILKSDKSELQNYSHGLENKVEEKIDDLQDKVIDLKIARDKIMNVANEIDEERQKTVEEKNKIDAILHSIGDGVFVVDKDQKVVIINEVAANMAGYKAEEILGTKYTDKLNFVFEKTGERNAEFIDKAFETKKVQKMSNHTVLIDKSGNRIQVSDSAAPLFDSDSNVIGCVVVFRNVTKEREVDKVKSEFVSLASHQLRTPLSVINWYSEMLLDGDAGQLNEEQKKYVEEVYKGNQRMVELVNSLLNVSRLELGTFTVEPELIDIAALVKSAVSELEPQIIEKKLNFKEHYGKGLPMFSADSKLLRMVFQNLISNAVKYTPESGEINAYMDMIESGEDFGGKNIKEKSIAFFISDTGYGITQSQQDKIFSKLFRADNVREKDMEGTGLGLYIVKAIVDLSGGSIWFESAENIGTTFYVTLPLEGMKKKEGIKKLS